MAQTDCTDTSDRAAASSESRRPMALNSMLAEAIGYGNQLEGCLEDVALFYDKPVPLERVRRLKRDLVKLADPVGVETSPNRPTR